MGDKKHSEGTSFNRLAAINRAITTSLNFNEVLTLIVVNAAELFSAETSLLLLADDDGILRVRAAHGRDSARSQDFSGQMEEAVIGDLSDRLRLHNREELVTVPVVVDGSINGFLAIVRESKLSAEEYWQIEALADQAAIALNNARLHEMETGEAWRQRDETLKALRESNQKTNRILESITDLFYQLDSEWRFIDLNRRVEVVFGKTREELIGHVIWEVYPQTVGTTLHTCCLKAVDEKVPVHFEVNSRIVPGVWFEAHAYPARGTLSLYLRDITERKLAEQEIGFRAHLLDTVEQAVIATDLDGRVIYWNSFAESLYGWSKSEAIGSSILAMTPAASVREQAEEILSRLKQGDSWSGEFLLQRKDGSLFPALVTDSPIFNDEGKLVGVVGVSVDITERKQAEAERERLFESEREARAEAERANALKDEFLATMSHELRNPLNVILGYTDVLLRNKEVTRSPFLRRAAEVLKRNAIAQSHLIGDLLDLSRLQSGKLSVNRETVALATLINHAVETVRAEATSKNIQLDVQVSDELLFVSADPLRLEQVIWNLLNNAVKFTFPGGKVELSLASEGEYAVLVVKDNGEGIDPEFLPKVFEMFRQADATSNRKHGGMGIGLALVRQLIELQGGTVTAASAGIDQGAEFTIRIPLCEEAKPRSATAALTAVKAALNHLRVLIVDDSEDTVGMLRRLFEIEGATVSSATSGTEALQIAANQEFDVIITDISMPVMDGFEFLRRLRLIPSQRDVPVLALTGFGRAEDVKSAAAAGFFSHATKPLDVDKLLQLLQEMAPETKVQARLRSARAEGRSASSPR